MKIVETHIEFLTLVTLLDGPLDVRRSLVEKLSADLFGYRPARELYDAYASQTEPIEALPSAATAARCWDISEGSQDLFLEFMKRNEPVKSENDANALVATLVRYRASRHLHRTMTAAATQMKEASEISPQAMTAMLDEIGEARASLSHKAPIRFSALDDDMSSLLATHEDKIRTGFAAFDDVTGGMARGQLFIPAAPTGKGKSTLTLQLAINACMQQSLSVLYCSLELTAHETQQRLASCLSGVEIGKFTNPATPPSKHEGKAIRAALTGFRNHLRTTGCEFAFVDHARTVEEYRQLLRGGSYDVLVVDHLKMSESKKLQGWEALMQTAEDLKQLAREANVLVVAPCQGNDDGDLRYAKGIKDPADWVWTWKSEEGSELLSVNQIKARHSRPFAFDLLADLACCRITDAPSYASRMAV